MCAVYLYAGRVPLCDKADRIISFNGSKEEAREDDVCAILLL